MNNEITGSMLRKAVEHHRTNGNLCIEGVAFKEDGRTRFLSNGEAPKSDETAVYFVFCPVCGKRLVKETESEENG